MEHSARKNGGGTWGIALIVIGTVLLLDRLGRIDIGDFWRLWPLVVIYYGAVQLFRPSDGKPSSWVFLLGIWLLVSSLELFGFGYDNSWPLLIILVGVAMLVDPRLKRRHAHAARQDDEGAVPQERERET